MRHKKIGFSESAPVLPSYYDFDTAETNADDIAKMKKVLKLAIVNELTEKQRFCISEYYLNGKNMKSIARELSVNPSTVTRHIQNAKRNLKRIAACYA